MNSNGSEQNKVIFTHPTQCRRVWLRGLGDWLNSSPYSWIFNSTLCMWIPGLAPFYFLARHHVWHKAHMCASLSRSARCSLASSQISRCHNDSFAWTEALSFMIFMAEQELSGRDQSMNITFNQYRNPKVQSTHAVSFVLLLPSCCFCFVFAGDYSKKSHLVTVSYHFWSFRALTAAVVVLRLLIHFLFELKKNGKNHF